MNMTVDPDTGEISHSDYQVAAAPFLRTPFNYDRDAVSQVTGLACLDESRAQQNMKEDADINTIVKRFGLTGQLPDNIRLPQYGDFTGVSDYQSALNQVMAAEDAFMQLPAHIRAEFHNDPQELIEAVDDPAKQARLIELGLATPRPQEGPKSGAGAPEPAKVDPPPPAEPKTA